VFSKQNELGDNPRIFKSLGWPYLPPILDGQSSALKMRIFG